MFALFVLKYVLKFLKTFVLKKFFSCAQACELGYCSGSYYAILLRNAAACGAGR